MEQLTQNLQRLSPDTSDRNNSISIYSGELTTLCVIENVKLLKHSFPALPKEFYDVLSQMVKEEGFTDQRLSDAVHHLVKTCVYPTPTIANILSFDKRMKLHNYNEMVKLVDEYGPRVWDMYFKRSINNQTYWLSKKEADQYGVKYE